MPADPTTTPRTTFIDLVRLYGRAVDAGEMTEADAVDALLAPGFSITREGAVQALKHWETIGNSDR